MKRFMATIPHMQHLFWSIHFIHSRQGVCSAHQLGFPAIVASFYSQLY
jgi:hypothetical protein